MKLSKLTKCHLRLLSVLLVICANLSLAEHQFSATLERSGRAVSNLASANMIENNTEKARIEIETRQVQEFLTTKNIFKSIVKLLFGSSEESKATSRHVLDILGKALDLLKITLGQKSRSGMARTLKDSVEDAAAASVSVLQGYVKSLMAIDNQQCVKRYLCQASKDAVRSGREMGSIVSTVGGYASSYLLDSSRSDKYHSYHEASQRGRTTSEDCAKIYSECASEF